jgi:hypothetical protein
MRTALGFASRFEGELQPLFKVVIPTHRPLAFVVRINDGFQFNPALARFVFRHARHRWILMGFIPISPSQIEFSRQRRGFRKCQFVIHRLNNSGSRRFTRQRHVNLGEPNGVCDFPDTALSDARLTGTAISAAWARQYFLPILRPAGLELLLLDIRFC